MNWRNKDEVPFLEFPNLAGFEGLVHGIFTRKGGCSQAPYRSLNVGYGVGDNPQRVSRNREIIARCMGVGEPVFIRQNHGTSIFSVDAGWSPQGEKPEADAMITAVPGRLLVIQVADCQSVLLYDPVRHAAANIHCGWRGSVVNIIGPTLDAMKVLYGCRSEDILAGIGPSLGPCCAEFIHYRKEIPEKYWGYRDGQNRFDFWSISRDQLQAAGVPRGKIHVAGICTRCRTDLFYSYRGEKETGRFAAAIGLTG